MSYFSFLKNISLHLNKGYTLIECMLAALIFVLVMLYGFVFFTYGQRDIEDIKITSYATTLAKDAIELLKSKDYDDIISTQTVVETFFRYNTQFIRTYGVVSEINTNSERYKIVFSSVSYQISNVPKEISIQTIISPF